MFGEHARTTGKHIRRSPYQALAAVLIMTITFFVATILALLAYSSASVINYYETKPRILAFLKDDATPEQVSSLQRKLEADPRVKEVEYVSKEQALKIYGEFHQDKPILTELVSPKVLPASLEFSTVDISFTQELITEIGKEEIVEDVGFELSLGGDLDTLKEVIGKLKNVTTYIRVGGSVILGFLLASSFFTLLVIISMRIASRREEIEILQLIGATPGFIRMPFILEGIFYAASGAVLGWSVMTVLTLYLMPSIVSFFRRVPVLPSELSGVLSLFGSILGAELALAIVLGALGSFVALRRYLKI